MPPELTAYLDYREISGGKPSTLEEFRTELQRFPRNAVVRLCAVMNTIVATWLGDFNLQVQMKFVRSFFPPRTADRIFATNRPVFHRHQLLFVMQQALQHCSKADSPIVGPYFDGLGTVLLMASDHLHTPMIDRADLSDKALQVMVSMIPTLEANQVTHYLNRIARSYLMLSKFTEPLRRTAEFVDVHALFEEATKLPLPTYQALVWGAVSRFAKVDELRITEDMSAFSIGPDWFLNTLVPEAQINSFLADISATPDGFAESLAQKNPQLNDFTVLRDKPFIDDLDRFFPVDFTFLSDKLESGLFWRVHNNFREKRDKDRLHVFWGHVFELYLNWIFQRACTGRPNHFYPDPKFLSDPNEQVCDGLIVCGRVAILMEYKGSTFTAASKYGGEIEPLKREIDEKLVGEPNRRKGVRQLAHAVERLGRPEDTDSIQGLDMSQIAVLMPVVITRDDIGSAWGINAYLDSRFKELKTAKKHWRPTTSLFCLSADDVEKISPLLSDISFADLLNARHKADKALMSSFWTAENRVIRKKGYKKPEFVFETMKELTRLTTRTLGLKPPVPTE
jgi:hypothetical protein